MPSASENETLKPGEKLTHLLEECRMVLPGIQALFGFQMIAVFNQGFSEKLTPPEQKLHIGAILLVVVSIALVMAPAAIHREAEPDEVSERFLRMSSRLLLMAMVALALAICADVFVVTDLVCHSTILAAGVALVSALLLTALWFVYPVVYRRGKANVRE